MSTLEIAAVERAMKILQAVNARFHIALETGDEFGAPLAPPKKERAPRRYLGPSNKNLIDAAFLGMQPGDECTLAPQPNDTPERLRNNCMTRAHRFWGSATSIVSEITPDKKVKVMRIE